MEKATIKSLVIKDFEEKKDQAKSHGKTYIVRDKLSYEMYANYRQTYFGQTLKKYILGKGYKWIKASQHADARKCLHGNTGIITW